MCMMYQFHRNQKPVGFSRCCECFTNVPKCKNQAAIFEATAYTAPNSFLWRREKKTPIRTFKERYFHCTFRIG
jgi:hypothetical protein